jgi:hypothetical protein
MKIILKKRLKSLLAQMAGEVDPAFASDTSLLSHPHIAAVRRNRYDEWEFVALAFSTVGDRFFVEAAISKKNEYPIDTIPLGPWSNKSHGILRFRAAELWGNLKSGGWVIAADGANAPNDIIGVPEGVYRNAESAMVDLKHRMQAWILPYFDARRQKR